MSLDQPASCGRQAVPLAPALSLLLLCLVCGSSEPTGAPSAARGDGVSGVVVSPSCSVAGTPLP